MCSGGLNTICFCRMLPKANFFAEFKYPSFPKLYTCVSSVAHFNHNSNKIFENCWGNPMVKALPVNGVPLFHIIHLDTNSSRFKFGLTSDCEL